MCGIVFPPIDVSDRQSGPGCKLALIPAPHLPVVQLGRLVNLWATFLCLHSGANKYVALRAAANSFSSLSGLAGRPFRAAGFRFLGCTQTSLPVPPAMTSGCHASVGECLLSTSADPSPLTPTGPLPSLLPGEVEGCTSSLRARRRYCHEEKKNMGNRENGALWAQGPSGA